MATLNNLFRKLLNVNTAVFSNMRIETSPDGVVTVYVEAKVNKRHAYRCPVCGRKCPGYDQGSRRVRRWRAPDMGGLLLFIETGQERILCTDHGVQYPAVPWHMKAAASRRILTERPPGWRASFPERLWRNT